MYVIESNGSLLTNALFVNIENWSLFMGAIYFPLYNNVTKSNTIIKGWFIKQIWCPHGIQVLYGFFPLCSREDKIICASVNHIIISFKWLKNNIDTYLHMCLLDEDVSHWSK